ncbi:hypothetical protein D3C79_951860 [compost metagenome]
MRQLCAKGSPGRAQWCPAKGLIGAPAWHLGGGGLVHGVVTGREAAQGGAPLRQRQQGAEDGQLLGQVLGAATGDQPGEGMLLPDGQAWVGAILQLGGHGSHRVGGG